MSRSARTLRPSVAITLALVISFAVSLGLARPAFAATFQLSGKVTDQSSNALAGVTVVVVDPSSATTVASTTTDANGNYALSVASGTYNVQVTPPADNAYGPAVVLNRSITGDTVLNFVLSPTGSVTLSGRVLDALGNGLANQQIALAPAAGGSSITTFSDSSGHYAFQVAAGGYILLLRGSNNLLGANVPYSYSLNTQQTLTLSQNTTFDLTLPLKKVSVHVQDPAGNPAWNVIVSTTAPTQYGLTLGPYTVYGASSYTGTNTDASGNAILWLFPTRSASYVVTARVRSGSPFATVNQANVAVNSDTSLTITLAYPVTLSGHVLNELGAGVPGQDVTLSPATGGYGAYALTDSTGKFAVQAAPDSYYLSLSGYNNAPAAGAPQVYSVTSKQSIPLTQDMTLDLPFPAKRVSVHVQDPNGNPVPGVALATNQTPQDVTIGPYTFSGYDDYTFSVVSTDSSGNATLWLFPIPSGLAIHAAPPTGSPFVTTVTPFFAVTADMSEVINLQFIHTTPVTTATATPSPSGQGVYPGPVTVALAASATPSSIIAHTYYTIDGGAQQTYSAPFTVSGDGSHTVMYWSVDNAGVYEIQKELDLQIVSLRIITPSLPGGTIGVAYSATLTAGGGTPPYTWSIASGALPPGLSLDASTGVISGTPTTAGTFGFTIQVTDSSQETTTTSFTLAPPPPSGTAGSSYSVPVAIPALSLGGSTGGTATCTSYFIVSGSLPPGVTLDQTTGVITGTPTNGGTYSFTVGCAVSGGGGETATKDFTITINNPAPAITGLHPGAAYAGGVSLTLTVNGTGFVTSSVVNWNGSSRPTTYISATQLSAAISAEDIASAGSVSITVTNPNPNGSTSNAVPFIINPPDSTPPEIEAYLQPLPNANRWNNSTVFVKWSVSDPESGIASSSGCDATSVRDETAGLTLTCTATNGVGLTSSQHVTIKLDETAPTTTAALAGTQGANGWYRSGVDVTLAASDSSAGSDGSGVAATYYALDNAACAPASLTGCTSYADPVHVSADGQHTIYFFSQDAAGNFEAQQTVSFKVDQTPPGPSQAALSGGTVGTGDWYTAPQSFTLTSSDATSQVASIYYQFVAHGAPVPSFTLPGGWMAYAAAFTAPAGDTDLYGFSMDNAGNVESPVNLGELKVDGTPPTTMATTSGIAGSNAWFTGPVTVSLAATDNAGGSGMQTITYSATGAQPISGTSVNADSATISIFTEGQTTITYAATDAAGNQEAAKQLVVKLDRTAPTVSDAQVNPNPVAINTALTLTAIVSDPGTGSSGVASASYTVDGGAHVVMSTQSGSAFNQATTDVTASLAPFATAGVHTFCVTGTDVAGNVSTATCVLLAVYDPSAGFVTGGGWITSPTGACQLSSACQGASGRANFGFVAKYQQGANVPTGETQFQFSAGSLNFHSTNYQWLVVAGAKAQYKGTGTVNGAGSYAFMLTATDGSLSGGGGVDKFRIKLTDSAGNVVYDNQMGASDTSDPTTAIGGGNIIIRSS